VVASRQVVGSVVGVLAVFVVGVLTLQRLDGMEEPAVPVAQPGGPGAAVELFGSIQDVDVAGTLSFDPAEWISGDEAVDIHFAMTGERDGPPGGYLIRDRTVRPLISTSRRTSR
jgi:hypothetical protein